MIVLLIFLCVFIICIPLLIIILYQNFSHLYKCLNKIPAEKKYPILGHFFSLTLQTPENHFLLDRKLAKQFYPIYHQSILNVGVVNLLSPEDIELVLTSSKLIKKSRIYDFLHCWLGTGLLTSDGTKWKNRRKLLTNTFHFSILQEFINVFNDSARYLVKKLEAKVEKDSNIIEIINPITECTLSVIAETAMGTKLDPKLDLNQKYKNSVHEFGLTVRDRMLRPWLYPDFVHSLTNNAFKTKKLVKNLHTFSSTIINQRKKNFQQSYSSIKKLAMLDLLLNAKNNEKNIDDAGIQEEVDTFMFEGHDTTSVALTFIFLLLANHQTIQEEIRQEIIEIIGDNQNPPTYAQLQEMSFLERCLKECLRIYPSVPFIARDCIEEFTTATGYTVPKGAMIHIHIYDLHHNENIYPNPEQFDPDRFLPENVKLRHPFAYIPFSAGPRNCIGQKFAMLELKSVVCEVLRNFYLEPIDKPEGVVFLRDLVLRSKNDVKVQFLKRECGQLFENRYIKNLKKNR